MAYLLLDSSTNITSSVIITSKKRRSTHENDHRTYRNTILNSFNIFHLFRMRSHMNGGKLTGLVKLNLRAVKLAMTNRWLSPDIYADSYDRLSANYDSSWRRHIETVTITLLDRLQAPKALEILDLGCGTGLSSRILASKFPGASVTGIDISKGMLSVAGKMTGPPNVRYKAEDMLIYLEKAEPESVDMIFSSWAIGYSKPGEIIAHASRVLKPGGTLAFIVNFADTLPEVFGAYKRTMIAFPEQMNMAMWPGFPTSRRFLEKHLRGCGFSIEHFRDDHVPINVQRNDKGKILPWLLETGALAGFDQAMNLDRVNRGSEFFESCLVDLKTLHHHFAEAIGIKNES